MVSSDHQCRRPSPPKEQAEEGARARGEPALAKKRGRRGASARPSGKVFKPCSESAMPSSRASPSLAVEGLHAMLHCVLIASGRTHLNIGKVEERSGRRHLEEHASKAPDVDLCACYRSIRHQRERGAHLAIPYRAEHNLGCTKRERLSRACAIWKKMSQHRMKRTYDAQQAAARQHWQSR